MVNDTKYLIAETLENMMQRKNIDKITVKDLVEECNISRQTFYYHFQDLIDVMEWILNQKLEKAVSDGIGATSREEAIRIFVEQTLRERPIIRKIIDSKHSEEITKICAEALRKYLYDMIRRKGIYIPANPGDIDAAIHFYGYGVSGLLLDYYNDKDADIDKITAQICQLIRPIDELSV